MRLLASVDSGMHSQGRALYELLITSWVITDMRTDAAVNSLWYTLAGLLIGMLQLTCHVVQDRFVGQTPCHRNCKGRLSKMDLPKEVFQVHVAAAGAIAVDLAIAVLDLVAAVVGVGVGVAVAVAVGAGPAAGAGPGAEPAVDVPAAGPGAGLVAELGVVIDAAPVAAPAAPAGPVVEPGVGPVVEPGVGSAVEPGAGPVVAPVVAPEVVAAVAAEAYRYRRRSEVGAQPLVQQTV